VAPPVLRPDVTPTALKCQKDSNVVRCESDAGDGHPQEMDVKIDRGNVMHNRVCTGSATVFAPSCLQKGTQALWGCPLKPAHELQRSHGPGAAPGPLARA